MSSADNLHDAHLKTALAHAPDKDLQPNAQVRNAVLDYAKQATMQRQTWLGHLKNWLLKDHFANAQWAGATGLAAVFLVTLMLWREHPEDTVGISDAPARISEDSVISDNKEISRAPELSNKNIALNQEVTPKKNAPVSAQSAPAEVVAAADGVTSSYKKQAAPPMETPKTVINKPLESDKERKQSAPKAESANSADASRKDDVASKHSKKSVDVDTAAAGMPSPQIAAPANVPTVAEAPPTTTIAADSAAKAASASEVAPSKLKPLTRETDQAEVSGPILDKSESIEKRRNIETQIGNLNQIDNHTLAKVIVQNGGQTLAASDIQAVKYRLLKVVVHGENNTNECKPPKTQTENVDANTGWHIENIDVCLATDKLMQEVALYNQAMNAWFLQQNVPKK